MVNASTGRLWPEAAAPQVIVLSGAGLSAESGVPTFRGTGGYWRGHDVMTVADFPTWRDNAALVHEFYNMRRTALPSVAPNAAHRQIADWMTRWPGRVWNITQNVDDLLERAGALDVIHVHGKLWEMRCVSCDTVMDIGCRSWALGQDRCVACGDGEAVKPGVVFFGESAPLYDVMWAALRSLRSQDTLVIIGTSGVVLPIGPMAATVAAGIRIFNGLEVPSGPTDAFTHHYFNPVTEAISGIDQLITERMT